MTEPKTVAGTRFNSKAEEVQITTCIHVQMRDFLLNAMRAAFMMTMLLEVPLRILEKN